MIGKSAMADTQFHWLFVILAGGFILFLFAIFINQGIIANQNKQTALMLQYFDGVLSSSQNVQNLNDPIDSTAGVTIEQKCEIGGQSRLVFTGQELEKKTTFLPIFSNHKISGVQYALKTLPYDAPFRVDNPVYLADTSTLYVVYSDDPDVQDEYVRLLPAHATVVTTSDLYSVTQTGFRNVVVITSDEGTSTIHGQITPTVAGFPAYMQSANLRHVDVSSTEKRVYYYYGLKTSDGVALLARSDFLGDVDAVDYSDYTDDALKLGAIMSEDPDLYLCNKDKLDARARVISMQIYERAAQLSAVDGIDTRCVASYESVRSDIDSMLLTANPMSQQTQDDVALENDRLIKYSCPTLY